MKKTSALLFALVANPVEAARAVDTLEECRAMIAAAERLACYDAIFLVPQSDDSLPPASGTAASDAAAQTAASTAEQIPAKPAKRKFRYRLLDENFSIQPHRPTYLLPYTYTTRVNTVPFANASATDSSDAGPTVEADREEVKFQISFKIPLATDLLLKDATLWAGYSQVSLWQMYNTDASAPFRETNYEPEIFWQVPTSLELFGVALDSVSLGFNHQSNGRGQDLSRSWNRIFSEVELSHNRWTMALRPWYRLPEDAEDDDNPDIDDYLGYGDISVRYKWHSDLSLTTQLRHNFHSRQPRTSVNMALVFPLAGPLNGYFEYVNGYGETLIDYNRRTRRVGIGVILNEWK
ncbi:phospholipase A [Pseudomaricurvus alcaniphilus]|uniref:phospholipase A n=1 Tax=Pseudomaricurvus alcaniphilus TaxID=1166482 RepID=UPI00140A7541|nr:phospholipase A [Pseudomaricurvus alcaniphilus]NHN38705.1 phospholipase A [Pseudomaricurvus alcaniphilus]